MCAAASEGVGERCLAPAIRDDHAGFAAPAQAGQRQQLAFDSALDPGFPNFQFRWGQAGYQ